MSVAQINAYVAAMFEIASANDAVSVVEDDMFRLARAIESNEQLRAALNDTSLPADRRQNIVEQLLGGKAHNVTVQLVSLLVGTGHISLLPQVADALVKRASSSKQMEVAEVRSAVVLTDAQKARLAEALSKVAGKPVNLKVVVDPSVIGGLVATIGDEVIDDTVRTRLDQVKARF
ncbi:MAG: ATP synthase F1 subunit delta [Ilumatobacteraceae bacterium]|jgi:F-type H+-transporting ATPase subunit delta|nr:ATP synthase F1 subunit delta [Ilumatobacteraceae bacterium]